MAFVSLDSPSCEVSCLILLSVVYRDVTRQANGLYRLKHGGALKRGLAYLSRCNSGWFCHNIILGIHLYCLSYVWNLILAHIWDALGFLSKTGCDKPCRWSNEKFDWYQMGLSLQDRSLNWALFENFKQSKPRGNYPMAIYVYEELTWESWLLGSHMKIQSNAKRWVWRMKLNPSGEKHEESNSILVDSFIIHILEASPQQELTYGRLEGYHSHLTIYMIVMVVRFSWHKYHSLQNLFVP
jgi:hypothetical protein